MSEKGVERQMILRRLKVVAALAVCAVAGCAVTGARTTHIAVADETIAAADEAVVPVDVRQVVVMGSPAKAEPVGVQYQGKNYQGVKLAISAPTTLIFPAEVNARKFNTLQFKVRLQSAADRPGLGELRLQDTPIGNWASTNFWNFAKKLDDDWYQFTWDVVYQPDNIVGINLASLGTVRLGYGVPEGKTDTLTFIDMKFVSGRRVDTGDPKLFKQWEAYIDSYKPDYSDSSKYLLPPPTGRIARPLALTKNGKPFSKIIVPQGASQPLTLAGNELQMWLKKISDAEIEIIAKPDGGNGTRVLLGRKFAAGKFDKDIAALGESDGFAVRTQGKNIYIFGATDKGTMNGVFAFLENNTDIIWPRPLKEVGVVYTRNPDINAVWADAREKPATTLRGWSVGERNESSLWAVRNRNNFLNSEGTVVKANVDKQKALGNDIQFGGGHNINNYLGKNPDFYPVIDGKKPDVFNIWLHQPNFTAPGIEDAVAKNVLQYIKERVPTGINCVTINIEDNWGLSTDPKSLEPIKLPDGTTIGPEDPAFRSTQFFIFLNKVVEKINKVHPKMMVETYAYFFTATVPKVPINPNIRIMFCPYPRKDYRTPLYSPFNDHWWRQMEAWSKASPNIIMREYLGIMNGFRPLAEVEAADLRAYVAHGIRYYTSEMNGDGVSSQRGDDFWNFLSQEYWIINRLYWNPNQDVEQLRKYFIRRTYHEAAPEMEKFFGIIRAEYFKGVLPMSFIDPLPFMNQIVIQPGHEDELRQLLAQAHKSAKNSTSRVQVDMLRSTFDRWAAQAKGQAPDPSALRADVLNLGWQPMIDWENGNPAWAMPTFIDRNGETIPAVRMTLHPEREIALDYVISLDMTPGMLKTKDGDVLTFTLNPAVANSLSRPLQLVLTAKDKNGAIIQAPADSFEPTPTGGVKVRWKLQASTKEDKPFDVTQLAQLNIIMPRSSIQEKTPMMFYLTDISLG
jgi:hypothetical protein